MPFFWVGDNLSFISRVFLLPLLWQTKTWKNPFPTLFVPLFQSAMEDVTGIFLARERSPFWWKALVPLLCWLSPRLILAIPVFFKLQFPSGK